MQKNTGKDELLFLSGLLPANIHDVKSNGTKLCLFGKSKLPAGSLSCVRICAKI